jgi:hypothetical protein
VRHRGASAWLLVRILLRFVAAGVVAWQGVAAASRGGAWYALAILLLALALFFAVTIAAILWIWAKESAAAKGHS